MEKSIYSQEYSHFLEKLRQARESKGLTQTEIAARLGQTQSFISKVERGERRVDIVELWAFCNAIGEKFSVFVQELDDNFRAKPSSDDFKS